MKISSLSMILLSLSSVGAFLCSYVFDLTMDNAEQFLAIAAVVLLDGFFGVIAGIKREGFKTYKALSVLRTLGVWWIILGTILAVENGFEVGWLSETIITPFIAFQLLSALKNASMVGLIEGEVLNQIIDKYDNHKGERTPKKK